MYHIQVAQGHRVGLQFPLSRLDQRVHGGRAKRMSKIETLYRIGGNRGFRSVTLILQQHFPG